MSRFAYHLLTFFHLEPLRRHLTDWRGSKGAAIQPDETCFLRKTFRAESGPDKASRRSADDEATVYVNGRQIVRPKGYDKPAVEVSLAILRRVKNVIAILAKSGKPEQARSAVLELKLKKESN